MDTFAAHSATGVGEVAGGAPGAADAAARAEAPPTEDLVPLSHPPVEALELSAVLHALSDPMRLRIVAQLWETGGERTCNSFNLPIVKSTCTHHFKVLREAGLIRQRVVGTKRVNTLRSDDIDTRFPGLLDAVVRGVETA